MNFFAQNGHTWCEQVCSSITKLTSQCGPLRGIPRSTWITKAITLTNEVGIEVVKAIFYNIDAHLIIDMDGKPLNDNRVAI